MKAAEIETRCSSTAAGLRGLGQPRGSSTAAGRATSQVDVAEVFSPPRVTEMARRYGIKTQKVGPCPGGGGSEGKVLNRILRWNQEGWQLEADPLPLPLRAEVTPP